MRPQQECVGGAAFGAGFGRDAKFRVCTSQPNSCLATRPYVCCTLMGLRYYTFKGVRLLLASSTATNGSEVLPVIKRAPRLRVK